MRIVFCLGVGACRVYRRGWANAFRASGHDVLVWDPSVRPPFDLFAEESFDALWLGTWELSRALIKCVARRPGTRVFLQAPNWGSFDVELDPQDTVQRATDGERRMVEAMRKSWANSPRHVITHYAQRWADRTHDGWAALGLAPLGLPLACDHTLFRPVSPLPELECDAVFVGGFWPYKGQNLAQYLLPLCHPQSGLHVKVFGWGPWPVVQFLGTLDDALMPHAFASARVCPNIFEPLSAKYGFDVNERSYQALGSGGFVVSEYVESAATDLFTGGEVVFAKTPAEFHEAVRHYASHPDERLPFIKRGLDSVRRKHTYLHRLRDLWLASGEESEAARCEDAIRDMGGTVPC